MLFRLSLLAPKAGLRFWLLALTLATSSAGASVSTEPIRRALENGQLDLANKWVQQEKSLKPNDPQVRFFEAVVLAQQGQTDKAMEAFRKLTETHPGMLEAHNNLGVLYAAKGRLEEARKALEAGLLVSGSVATLHRNLGDVQSQLVRQSYARALQVEGKNRTAPPQLALLGSLESDNFSAAPVVAAANARPGPDPVKTPAPASTPSASAPAGTSSPSGAASSASPSSPSGAGVPASAARPAVSVPAATAAPASAASSAPAQVNLEKRPSQPLSADKTTKIPDPENEKIRQAVIAWAKAWSRKDMSAYLSAYASNFSPGEKMSRAKWEEERKLRILSKRKISVEIRAIKVTMRDETRASVQFQQIYESDNFSGNSRKSLEMVKQQGQWLILRETVN